MFKLGDNKQVKRCKYLMVKKGWVMIFNIHEFDSNPLTFINIYDPKPF